MSKADGREGKGEWLESDELREAEAGGGGGDSDEGRLFDSMMAMAGSKQQQRI